MQRDILKGRYREIPEGRDDGPHQAMRRNRNMATLHFNGRAARSYQWGSAGLVIWDSRSMPLANIIVNHLLCLQTESLEAGEWGEKEISHGYH